MHYPDYISHYGTKGQKWGRRRYQNPDGTYTEVGLMRRRRENKILTYSKKRAKAVEKKKSLKEPYKKAYTKAEKAKSVYFDKKQKQLRAERHYDKALNGFLPRSTTIARIRLNKANNALEKATIKKDRAESYRDRLQSKILNADYKEALYNRKYNERVKKLKNKYGDRSMNDLEKWAREHNEWYDY